MKKWERQRAKGRGLFVLKTALAWGGLMIASMTLFEYLTSGTIRAESLSVRVGTILLGGLVMGWTIWGDTERRYREYLRESRAGVGGAPARADEGGEKLTAKS